MTISWSGFTDDHSGIAKYEWCVDICGNKCTKFEVLPSLRGYVQQNSSRYFEKLVVGKYYCATIRATDRAGHQITGKSTAMQFTDTSLAGVVTDGRDINRDIDHLHHLEKNLSACWTGFADNVLKYKVNFSSLSMETDNRLCSENKCN